jgi:hypothetical protein
MTELEKLLAETASLFRAPVYSHWSPQWASHVIGLFGERTEEGQRYRCYCTICGIEHRGVCLTGAVRNHVTHFAAAHYHKDPFTAR